MGKCVRLWGYGYISMIINSKHILYTFIGLRCLKSLKNHRYHALNSTRNFFVCWFAWIVHCFKCFHCFWLPAFSWSRGPPFSAQWVNKWLRNACIMNASMLWCGDTSMETSTVNRCDLSLNNVVNRDAFKDQTLKRGPTLFISIWILGSFGFVQ